MFAVNEETVNQKYSTDSTGPVVSGPNESKRPFVFLPALISMALLWLSFPPVGLAPLGWFALVPLIWVTLQERHFSRVDYRKLWAAGLGYWLATFYFIPIPHPALWLGWIVISLYLACYLPLFVFSVRSMHANFRIPNLFAVPICWTAMELIRSYLLTGMGLVCLSHTQFRFPVWIQISDLFGAYTLTFVMVMAGTGMVRLLRIREGKPAAAVVNFAIASCFVGATYMYGHHRLEEQVESSERSIKVGLIQGSIDTVFPATVEEARAYRQQIADHYEQLSIEALKRWNEVNLIVWPENGWQYPDLHPDTDKSRILEVDLRLYEDSPQIAWSHLMQSGKPIPPMLVGAVTGDPIRREQYGSVLHLDESGLVQNRYYKNHLVMFGEYVPLANIFPLLQRIPAIGKGLQAGDQPLVIDVNGVRVAPNICFETTVPHYICKQVNKLASNNLEPDVLVNVTNDGWFHGTSCLDFHLACNVFRAVEMRKPNLVCANTGISAHIDRFGRIQQEVERRKTGKILATVSAVEMDSHYRHIKDWVVIAFAALALLATVVGMFRRPAE